MIDFAPTPLELQFWNALALIAAACLVVPAFRRAGLGAVLGFLAAGLVVQIVVPGTIAEHPEELLHFAEFGVVLFLFVIGLELRPSTLWAMRGDIFGLGMAQMLACGLVLAVPAWLVGLPPATALVVGLGLALSSTALVMQSLDEHGERSTPYGRKTFAILLLQDLAIVPLLLLVTLLAPVSTDVGMMEGLGQVALALGAIALLVVIGRYLLDPMFRLLARTGLQELMTASALGVVIAAGLLMDLVGMSYAMGAFIAGVMLAESAYRHEVEANIEPFRGLFLGLFFMAVGLALDLQVVTANALLILAVTPVAMCLKAIAIYGVATFFGSAHADAVRIAIALPQHGEFGFVLFAAASLAGVLDPATTAVLVAVITASMALSPLVSRLVPFLVGRQQPPTMSESFDDARGSVLVIGFGRFGQVVSQPLFGAGFEVTILDRDAERVRDAGRFGFRVHFGDGARRDVLRAAGAGDAQMLVVCVDEPETADRIVALAQEVFPEAKLFVRAYDRRHWIALKQAGVDFTARETFEAALRMGEHVLMGLGTTPERAASVVEDVRERDRDRLRQQAEGDLTSGLDRLHTQPVRPEPLSTPETEAGVASQQ